MLGNPKYKMGDKVSFVINNETINGEIAIIDRYGTFEDNSDVSYDVYSKENNILYKHINENYIIYGKEN
jgi:hypothetical protein